MYFQQIKNVLLGVAIGDAVGVPFEFKSRATMQAFPAKDMIGFGSHRQPEGTWSDDSSMMFCLAESLVSGYRLEDLAQRFVNWKEHAYWTAHDEVFDIGITTSAAIARLKKLLLTNNIDGIYTQKNTSDEMENGNGSLMRILPLLFYIKGKLIREQFSIVYENSALTHRHIRSAMCCMIYLKLAEKILEGKDKNLAYNETRIEIQQLWEMLDFPESEKLHFQKVIQEDIRLTDIEDIKTGGYVMQSLESCFWFFMNKDNYKDTVLSIINLGHDTDTSAAIVGGIAALYYGEESIPEKWKDRLVKRKEIEDLAYRLSTVLF